MFSPGSFRRSATPPVFPRVQLALSQSTLLVGLLAAAFLLYVAAKGRLPTYTGVLWGKKADASNSGGGGDDKSKTDKTVDTAITIGEHVLPYVLA